MWVRLHDTSADTGSSRPAGQRVGRQPASPRQASCTMTKTSCRPMSGKHEIIGTRRSRARWP